MIIIIITNEVNKCQFQFCLIDVLLYLKAIRGYAPNGIWMDEAAFCGPRIMSDVIGPMSSATGRVCVLSSTPEGDSNWFSIWAKKPTVNLIQIGTGCSSCEVKKITCTHAHRNLPPIHSYKRQKRTREMMNASQDRVNRELGGMISSMDKEYFMRDYAHVLQSKHQYQFSFEPRYVYIAVDPSNGGTSSDFAIISMCVCSDEWVIVGMDAIQRIESQKMFNLLSDHLSALRENHWLQNSEFIMLIEANLNRTIAHQLGTYCINKDYGRVKCIRSDPKFEDQIGVWTDNDSKNMWYTEFKWAIEKNCLSFAEQIASNDLEYCQTSLFKQMAEFARYSKEPKDPIIGKVRFFYSGKFSNGKDDLVCALQMCLMWGQLLEQKRVY